MKKPAVLRVATEFKRVGQEKTKTRPAGAKVTYERSGACLGEFLIWADRFHYAKVDAVKLHDVLSVTPKHAPPPVPRAELSTLKMTTGNEKKYTKVILNGRLREWVGIGWIDVDTATELDKLEYPTVVD